MFVVASHMAVAITDSDAPEGMQNGRSIAAAEVRA